MSWSSRNSIDSVGCDSNPQVNEKSWYSVSSGYNRVNWTAEEKEEYRVNGTYPERLAVKNREDYYRNHEWYKARDAPIICIVCNEDVKMDDREGVSTPCEHVFHDYCLIPEQNDYTSIECPKCKIKLPKIPKFNN